MATREASAAVGMALVLACAGSAPASERLGIGRPASEAEIAAWNIDIDRDGRKLPPGHGSVAQGRGLRRAVRVLPRRPGRGRDRRAARRRAGHARLGEAAQDRRQLLALRADPVRLHPAGDADERTAIAQRRRGLRGLGLRAVPERARPGERRARRRHPGRRPHAEPRRVRSRSQARRETLTGAAYPMRPPGPARRRAATALWPFRHCLRNIITFGCRGVDPAGRRGKYPPAKVLRARLGAGTGRRRALRAASGSAPHLWTGRSRSARPPVPRAGTVRRRR